MPAASATCAEGKSCAVIMVMGSFFLYMDLRVPIVTFFLEREEGVPKGECELRLVWWKERSVRVASRDDGNDEGGIDMDREARANEAHERSVVESVFIV